MLLLRANLGSNVEHECFQVSSENSSNCKNNIFVVFIQSFSYVQILSSIVLSKIFISSNKVFVMSKRKNFEFRAEIFKICAQFVY